jgi:hypothetical protein
MFDWPELLILGIQSLRLYFRKRQSRNWPIASGTVQPGKVVRGHGFWAPDSYRSILGYTFSANGSPRYSGLFALRAEHEDTAHMLQKQAASTKVKVRYNPENPDISVLEDDQILGRKITQNPHWLP